MGNCQTSCASIDSEFATQIDVCSVFQSESATFAAEFAKTPRIDSPQLKVPDVRIPRVSIGRTLDRSPPLPDAKLPRNLPPLMLRRPGETYRETIAMNNVLAQPPEVTYRSDFSMDSERSFDHASGAEAVPVPSFHAEDDIGALGQPAHTELPQLMLRRPGETYREQIAMANILAHPPNVSSRSASRSDNSMDSEEDDTCESGSQHVGTMSHGHLPSNATSIPHPVGCGDTAAGSSGQPGSAAETTAHRPISTREESGSDRLELVSTTAEAHGKLSLEKTVSKIPLLNLRRPGETHREQVAMAKVSADPPDMTSRSDWSAAPSEVHDWQAIHSAALLMQAWRDSMDFAEYSFLKEFARECIQPALALSTRTSIEQVPPAAVWEERNASLLLHTWRDSMDADEHGLRDFAKMCAQQVQSELIESDRVPIKKCIQIPRLMLRRPGETYREQLALANVSIAAHMTARPKWSATRRGISDDTQDGLSVYAVDVDHSVIADSQRSRRQSRGVSEMTCNEQMQNEASKLARSSALRGPGQIFGEGKVAADEQRKIGMLNVAPLPTELPSKKVLSVVPSGKVKGLAAMWEKKQVSASVAARNTSIAKPTAGKTPGASCEKVVAGEVAQIVSVASRGSTPETCATPSRARRFSGATPLRACHSTA